MGRCKDACPIRPTSLNKQRLRTESWERWRLGVYAAVLFTAISLLPQVNFWRFRGHNWHGAFQSYHPDETQYAAYVNSLIDGRPRRNDPYFGRSDQSLPESFLSIQFIPAYSLAVPARLLGLSTMTMFIVLVPIAAFASVLALFWLIRQVSNDGRVAAAGALFVLSMGGLVRGQWLLKKLGGLETSYIFLPFLRRYQPGFSFPLFFLFCGLVWMLLRARNRRAVLGIMISAALTFSVLVFSYYFVWTAAAAWMFGLVCMLPIVRGENWLRDLRRLGQLSGLMGLPLIAYVYLLTHVAPSADAQQALRYTHAPDLLRPPAMLCLLLLLILMLMFRRAHKSQPAHPLLLALSFAVAPLIMFNQQVVTGRSLQPIHYEEFIANYVSLVALVLTSILLWARMKQNKKIPALLLILIAVISVARASQEAWRGARRLTLSTSMDESRPAALRLAQIDRSSVGGSNKQSHLVLVLGPASARVMDVLPITAPQSVLWAPHAFGFSGLTPDEDRRRFYQLLYYSNVDLQTLRANTLEGIYFRLESFGWERVIPGLSATWRPITDAEQESALADYQKFVDRFDHTLAVEPQLDFLIVAANSPTDFSRIDRWYERDAGEQVGEYVIYRVRPRP
jgi:hypothetical protein